MNVLTLAVENGLGLAAPFDRFLDDKIETKVTTGTHEEMLAELEGPVREPLPPAPGAGLNGAHEHALDGLGKTE